MGEKMYTEDYNGKMQNKDSQNEMRDIDKNEVFSLVRRLQSLNPTECNTC